MEIKNLNIGIIGAKKSGIAAALLAKKHGAIPFVSDIDSSEKTKANVERLKNENISFELGVHSDKLFDCDLIVVSPGVPSEAEIIKKLLLLEKKIISEIEFASMFCDLDIIAITGSNGKTTTTSLIAYIFNKAGLTSQAAGNIGYAFSEFLLNVKNEKVAVLEVSSFQLDFIDRFKPKISVLLNIQPDHLDRYENDFEKYKKSKFRIFMNQDEENFAILNRDCINSYEYYNNIKAKKLLFSTQKEISDGSFFDTVGVYYSFLGTKEKIIDYKEMSLRGIHNAQNSMAAICVAKAYGLDSDLIRDSLKTFPGVEHRLELVRTIDGIKFINDSKATNVDSVYWALQSFEEPIILIMGGKDKGNNYDAIRDLVQNRVKKIFAIGSSANKIFNYFHKIVKVEIKESLEECVKAAFMEARNNDVILLSPACASFDMFENFEHRGKVFKDAVMSL